MNEKLNVQDLIDMLAEKHGMNKKDAENFVKEFFQLVEESLEKDKYVKIRGLGTFKLIDVESRESVNVNTGERFEIQGHTKVSFTPEPALKDIINRPFSHFETVVLNDNTVLEDTPLENDNEEESVDSKTSEAEEIAQVIEEKIEPESPESISNEPELPEEMHAEDNEVSADAAVVPEMLELAEDSDVGVVKENNDASTMKYFIGIVVFVVALCGGAVAFMYYPDLLDKFTEKALVEEVSESETNEADGKDMTVVADSLLTKEVVASVEAVTVAEILAKVPKPEVAPKVDVHQPVPTAKKEQKKTSAAPFEPDSVGYTIVGTETTNTIKEGETLTKVSLRFYGTKALWPYLVKHNPGVIKNPDNVPFGTTIKIPKLVKKQ